MTYFVLRLNYSPHGCDIPEATLNFIQWFLEACTPGVIQSQLDFARLPEQMREEVLEQMLNEVLCDVEPAGAVTSITTVEVSVPALSDDLFNAFAAA